MLRRRGEVVAAALGVLLGPLCAGAAELPKLEQVGLCYTGFGVPGSGRPFAFGDMVLVNAGEGYPTVIDASDKARPKIVRYIPSWYFTSIIYPLPARDLVYLSSSRGKLLMLRGLKTLATQGELKEIPWDGSKWGRSFLAGLRADGIGYTATTKDIVVLDLNDPEHPKELARIAVTRLKGEGMPTLPEDHAVGATLVREGYQLTFCPDHSLSAAILDGGLRVALLEWKSPTEPLVRGEFENAEVHEKTGPPAYGRVLAMDKERLVLGHPASTSKYWRCRELTLFDIRDPDKPKRVAHVAFDEPGTHIRDIALAGRYVFVADGRNIASGHGVSRNQHSRLYVLDTQQLVPPEDKGKAKLERLEDEGPLPSPKVVATFEDTMPTEYSQLSLVGTTLYVNDYDFGLWLFDVSDPLKPTKLGGAPVSAEGHWLYLKGDHAFMGHTFGGTIHVINVADPAKPKTVGYYWDGQWLNYKAKIRGKGDAMYLPQEDGLAIVDISEPSRPRRAGEFLDAQGQPLHAPCLDVSDTYAFVAAAPRGKIPCRLLVYAIAEPMKPALVSTTELKDGKGFRVLRAGKMLYLVGYTGKRIVAVDASEPKRPLVTADVNAGEVRIGDRTHSLEIKDGGGNGAPGLAFSRGYLYVTTALEAPNPYLLIFDVRDPAAIRPAGALDVTDRKGWQYFACDVVIEGTRLILGDYGCEEVYDITEPLAPKRLARYRRSYAWQAGVVRGGLLFVPKLDGLEVLRLP
ncbi:MAG TPA: hypothetical protein VNE39_24455 [Planctomycetota bacterium]|nr:hypothetical protein [Planctomycetota bacterium]